MCEYYPIKITTSHVVAIKHLKYGLSELEAYCIKNINLSMKKELVFLLGIFWSRTFFSNWKLHFLLVMVEIKHFWYYFLLVLDYNLTSEYGIPILDIKVKAIKLKKF